MRGRPALPVAEKWCVQCGDTLQRHRFPSGRLETPKAYEVRRYCGAACLLEYAREMKEEKRMSVKYQEEWPQCMKCLTLRPPITLEGNKCKDTEWCSARLKEVVK